MAELATLGFSHLVLGFARSRRRILCVVMRQSQRIPEGTSRSTLFHLVGPCLGEDVKLIDETPMMLI